MPNYWKTIFGTKHVHQFRLKGFCSKGQPENELISQTLRKISQWKNDLKF